MERETPGLTGESLGKWDRVEQSSSIVPSLTPPPQTAPQHSKEVDPVQANT